MVRLWLIASSVGMAVLARMWMLLSPLEKHFDVEFCVARSRRMQFSSPRDHIPWPKF
jgi:hypothetical protein